MQLERRHDLIPNLIETVKGYAAHEKSTLEGVVEARNAAIQAKGAGPEQQAQAENVLTGALKSLFALAEAYPDLKANQSFLSLQEELTSTEDRIAYARQFYNDSVMKYDNKIQSIPSNIIAGMFGFKSREYFQAEAGCDRGAQGPVLSALPAAGRERRPAPPTSIPRFSLYEQIAANKRKTFFLIFGFVAPARSLVGAAFDLLLARRRDRDRDRRGDRDRVVGRVVLQQRQGRARDLAREAGRPAAVRPALQPRRGAVHRERAAEAAPVHHRRPGARTRSRPAATRSTPRSRSPPACSRR